MQLIGHLPYNTDYIILRRDRDTGKYEAKFLSKEEVECGLCGVRADAVISLANMEEKFIKEVVTPLIATNHLSRQEVKLYLVNVLAGS